MPTTALLMAATLAACALINAPRTICPGMLPPGLPAGLTWVTHDRDICIATDSGIRQIYRWGGDGYPSGLVWSPDGQTLAVQDFPAVEFVSIAGEVREMPELEPQWYMDRPRRGALEDPVLSANGEFVAAYRPNVGLLLGASGPQARLRHVTDGPGELAWSPDSAWLAFDKPAVWRWEVGRLFLVRSNGTSLIEVAVFAGSPAWRP